MWIICVHHLGIWHIATVHRNLDANSTSRLHGRKSREQQGSFIGIGLSGRYFNFDSDARLLLHNSWPSSPLIPGKRIILTCYFVIYGKSLSPSPPQVVPLLAFQTVWINFLISTKRVSSIRLENPLSLNTLTC